MAFGGIGGPGIGLPTPLAGLGNIGLGGTNQIQLASGQAFILPAGSYWATMGRYSVLQLLDQITGVWRDMSGFAFGSRAAVVKSDGGNYRIFNPTGTVVGAYVSAGGSGYTSPPTVTASAGGATFQAILGGAVGTVTLNASGGYTGGNAYTYPPMVTFSAPPVGGIPASGYAVLTSGQISSIVVTNQGAGYTTAPTIYIQQDSADTGTSIVAAVAACVLTGSGTVTGILVTNHGLGTLTSLPTLTIAGGGGTGATAVAVGCFSITGCTVGTAGAALSGTVAQILSVGGLQSTSGGSVVNPTMGGAGLFHVRPANIYCTITSGALSGTPVIADAGVFQTAPVAVVIQNASSTAVTTSPAATFTIGGQTDSNYITPI